MAKLRKDYKDDLKWNVKDLYASEEDYQKAYQTLEKDLEKYKDYQGHILDSASKLLEFLEFDTKLNATLEQIIIYTHLRSDEDTANIEGQKLYGEAINLYSKYNEATAYVIPEILKKDWKLIEGYIEEETKLKEYERILKEIFKFQKYTLSAKEEQIISSMTKSLSTPDDVYSVLTDADMRFGYIKNEEGKREELTEKSYHKLIFSNDRKVRKDTFNKLLKTYGNFKNTYANLLMGEVQNKNIIARIRGYKSSLEASLYSNDIPLEIYDNLIKTVKKNVEPLSDFWKLKKEALQVKELHLYDTFAPFTKASKKEYNKEEAQELLNKALRVLGETYLNDFNKAFEERWIDFCPNDGKRNGAYCTACYNTHPYVLLSYDGTLDSVSTLAHEMGHAMHYYYAIKNQRYQDYGYSIFVAEVASQVNQILLSKYLIKNSKDIEEKKYLIADLIQDFKSTIYRQTMFAEFEKIIHEKEAQREVLTHEALSNIYYQLNLEYFGENIVVDDIVKYEWARIPHFYMNFYVYQYATAYAAAIKIAMDLLNNKEGMQEKYLEFLSLGATKSPIESLKVANVDMQKSDTLEEAFKYFKDLIQELEGYLEVGAKNE